jgi:hypothetical protein
LNAANSIDRRIEKIFHQIHEIISRYFAHPIYSLGEYEHEMRIFCTLINRKLNEWREQDGSNTCDEFSLYRPLDLFK